MGLKIIFKFSYFLIFNLVEQLSIGTEVVEHCRTRMTSIQPHTKWRPFSQDTLVKIRARGVNHVKTASVAHLGCTRSIEQMRKNANFPVKIGVIWRASR